MPSAPKAFPFRGRWQPEGLTKEVVPVHNKYENIAPETAAATIPVPCSLIYRALPEKSRLIPQNHYTNYFTNMIKYDGNMFEI